MPPDATQIPQPDYSDLWNAFLAGFKSAKSHPNASEYLIGRSADAYCKLVHLNKDPKSFHELND